MFDVLDGWFEDPREEASYWVRFCLWNAVADCFFLCLGVFLLAYSSTTGYLAHDPKVAGNSGFGTGLFLAFYGAVCFRNSYTGLCQWLGDLDDLTIYEILLILEFRKIYRELRPIQAMKDYLDGKIPVLPEASERSIAPRYRLP